MFVKKIKAVFSNDMQLYDDEQILPISMETAL